MSYLYNNNAESTLVAPISPSDTMININPAQSALFPTITAGKTFFVTVKSAINSSLEIMEVTATAAGTFTVTRAQDGTTALQFFVGDVVSLRLVAKQIRNFADLITFASSIGSTLIGFIAYGVGAVLRTLQDKLRDEVNVLDYGADPTGVVDSTLAIQRAINAASATKAKLRIPAGFWALDPANGTALDVTKYAYGDSVLQAALVIPYELRVRTAGTGTQFLFNNLNSTTSVGVAIAQPTGSTSQSTFVCDGFMVRAIGLTGRYGVLAPMSAGLFANFRPKYFFCTPIHFCGASDARTVLVSPNEGWAVGVQIGDTVGTDIHITGYGTYNPTVTDVGQHHMTAFNVTSAVGAYGIRPKIVITTMYHGIEFGFGVEGFYIAGCEFEGVHRGIVTSSSGIDPGGFIDNVHINAVREGIRLQNRARIHIGKVEVYKASSYYTDAIYNTGPASVTPPTAAFTASQSGFTLTVAAISSGALAVGSKVYVSGVLIGTVTVGSGGVGSYTLDTSATIASTAMTAISLFVSSTAWNAVRKINSNTDIEYLTVEPADLFRYDKNCAVIASDGAPGSTTSCIRLGGADVRSCWRIAQLDGTPDCKVGDLTTQNVDTIFTLVNNATDITGGNVSVRSVNPTTYYTSDGTIDKRRLQFPATTLITRQKFMEVNSDDASGGFTIQPRLTANEFQITLVAGSGAHTYNLNLSEVDAIDGDVVFVKLNGSSSTNPTVNIYSGAARVLLSTFKSTNLGTNRVMARYVFAAIDNIWKETIYTSVETTY